MVYLLPFLCGVSVAIHVWCICCCSYVCTEMWCHPMCLRLHMVLFVSGKWFPEEEIRLAEAIYNLTGVKPSMYDVFQSKSMEGC